MQNLSRPWQGCLAGAVALTVLLPVLVFSAGVPFLTALWVLGPVAVLVILTWWLLARRVGRIGGGPFFALILVGALVWMWGLSTIALPATEERTPKEWFPLGVFVIDAGGADVSAEVATRSRDDLPYVYWYLEHEAIVVALDLVLHEGERLAIRFPEATSVTDATVEDDGEAVPEDWWTASRYDGSTCAECNYSHAWMDYSLTPDRDVSLEVRVTGWGPNSAKPVGLWKTSRRMAISSPMPLVLMAQDQSAFMLAETGGGVRVARDKVHFSTEGAVTYYRVDAYTSWVGLAADYLEPVIGLAVGLFAGLLLSPRPEE
ncbi:MAG: hypothetical protein Q4G67_01120 [Actinomycetia bacterium]|nr:hypothetical protein [Actinomycetes bacterium]